MPIQKFTGLSTMTIAPVAATVQGANAGAVYTIPRLLGSGSTLSLITGTNANLTLTAGSTITAGTGIGLTTQTAEVREVLGQLAIEYPVALTGDAVSSTPLLYRVVLLEGQSNMDGRGTRDPAFDTDSTSIFYYGRDSGVPATYQKITPGIIPIGGLSGTGVSPGESWAKAYAATLPANEALLVVAVAQGGTALVGSTWAVGGFLQGQAKSAANAAIAAAKAVNPASSFVGIISLQGEADGDSAQTTAAWKAAKVAQIADYRANITGASGSWYVIGSMVPEAIAGSATTGIGRTGYRAIDAAQMQTVLAVQNIAYERGIRGYSGDALHYTAPGDRLVGPAWLPAIARVAKPEVRYDFEADVVGSVLPIGMTSACAGASAPSVVTGKGLTFTGGTAGNGTDLFAMKFDGAEAMTDQVVEWSTSGSSGSARPCMVLRAQTGSAPALVNGWDGYLIQDGSRTGQNLRLFRVSGGSLSSALTTITMGYLQSRRFRASAIGTSIRIDYSDDGGTTWTIGTPVTDATFASGGLGHMQSFGSTPGVTVLDDVRIRTVI